ncbi:TraK family protein [Erwinia pyrifoliae]|uniref:TraK family protein n=1 Tax=Erwinia pyrifoliae TaxID=79967 RepID=UPI00223B72FB|nr:TraK family protein [Erwinia pyrifoliae]MCT2388848.1 TraK family protein [Erwinia pyrifoliae]MCU8589042.1 TraK family protein [Erwinia pyrifoliae]
MAKKNEVKTASSDYGAGRVAFIAHLDAIKNELDQGWPMTVVYSKFETEIGVSYHQFRRYVKKFLVDPHQEESSVYTQDIGGKDDSHKAEKGSMYTNPNPANEKPNALGSRPPSFKHGSVPPDDDSLI